MIRAGIIGSGGYAAGELIRLLLAHPGATLAWAQSRSQAGKPIWAVHDDLVGDTNLMFVAEPDLDAIDVVFLCGGHGQSKAWLQAHPLPDQVAVIDLSHDFRLDLDFVYGLPELNREAIQQSRRIANPGCFATAIQLALLPLAVDGGLTHEVHINATTGSTGAGQALQDTLHFSWRHSNLSVYKAFQHQHLAEIGRSLAQAQGAAPLPELLFVPQRGGFTRGIMATVYTHSPLSLAELQARYSGFYASAPCTQVTEVNPHLKQVTNTNKALLYLEKHGERVFIVSMIDNLLKGAAGQAIENMNLVFGLSQATGLQLKGNVF